MTNNYRRNLRESVPALTTTLFLGDLSVLCNEFHVRELFSRYGELERVQLKKSDRDPHRAHLGFGFVKFSSRASAERALEELNGYFFMGRALRVGWADDYNRVGGEVKARDPKKNRETAQLHVSFVCEDSCRMVSEMELGLVFGVFGNVVDIAIKKNVLNKVSGVQSGYAFVHFALTLGGLESALSAAERVNERMIDGIRYKCKTDQALLMQYMSLKSCNGSEPFKAQTLKIKSAFIPVPVAASTTRYSERSTHDVTYHPEPFLHVGSDSNYWSEERPGNPAIPLDTHALRFSTYGSSVEDQIVYSSPLSSDVSFLKAKRDQQYIDKSVMHNEPSSVTQRFSSATDNDFLRLLVLPFSRSPSSSLSSSSSYDEVPFHPRYATMYHHTSQE